MEAWRLVAAALLALVLGASQLQAGALPAWTFPVVCGIALLSVLLLLALNWRR
jgi:hypothetical protein